MEYIYQKYNTGKYAVLSQHQKYIAIKQIKKISINQL